MSTLLRAIVYVFLHNLLNVLVQIANKMGLQKKVCPVSITLNSDFTNMVTNKCVNYVCVCTHTHTHTHRCS
jgi:hypothetical protein